MTQAKVQEKETLASAMASAFADIQSAMKDANNPHFKSKYADLSSVIDAVKPALVKHGLFFTQRPEPAQGGVQIETMLHHSSGESMELGKLFVPANKNDAQAYGSALTYARRYALVTAFGVPTEDDDGNAAAKSPPAERQPVDEPAFPEGPCKNITQMKAAVRQLWREIEGTGDDDELFALLNHVPENKVLLKQVSALEHPGHRRELWEGDGKDNPGLRGCIERKRLSFNTIQAG